MGAVGRQNQRNQEGGVSQSLVSSVRETEEKKIVWVGGRESVLEVISQSVTCIN